MFVAVVAVATLATETQSGSSEQAQGLLLPTIGCQGSPATEVVSTDFASFVTDDWHVGGSAEWDDGGERIVLTTATGIQQAGRLYLLTPLESCGFRAEFDFTIGGGSGADGLTLAVSPSVDYDPAPGGGMDFCPDGGFAVDFDEYFQNTGDPFGEHVGVVEGCGEEQVASALAVVSGSHHAVVDFIDGEIAVYLDGSFLLVHEFDAMPGFAGYIGFTAGTGALTNEHAIDNFTLEVVLPRAQGDLNCGGDVTVVDTLTLLLDLQVFPIEQERFCPRPSGSFGSVLFADVNCDGVVDDRDVLALLAWQAGVDYATFADPCIPIGEVLAVYEV